MDNKFIKLLCSLPIILIFLYFLPFVGICLILLRGFAYKNKSKISTPIILIGVGIFIYIPKTLNYLFKLLNIESETIPYFNTIVNSKIYNSNFMDYSKYLITAGVILLIISFILKSIVQKVNNKINTGMQSYINESIKKDAEISKQNDMEIKIKQQKAKVSSYVKCPSCGKDIIAKRSRTGRVFYGCSGYPECQQSYWNKPIEKQCPKCGSLLVEKKSKNTITTEMENPW